MKVVIRYVVEILVGILFLPIFLVLGLIYGTACMYISYHRGCEETINGK